MIRANFDLTTGWTFDIPEELDEHIGVSFSDGDTYRLDATRLAFGITQYADDEVMLSEHWPPSGVVWREVTNDHIFPFQSYRRGDLRLVVWAEVDGVRTEAEVTYFHAPHPQPYASWTWDGWFWQAPVPMPDDGHYYYWDEERQEWLHTPPSSEAFTAGVH